MQFAKIEKKTGKIVQLSPQPINLQQQEGDQYEVMQVEDDAKQGDQPRHSPPPSGQQARNPAQDQAGKNNPNPKQGTEGTKA